MVTLVNIKTEQEIPSRKALGYKNRQNKLKTSPSIYLVRQTLPGQAKGSHTLEQRGS